MHIIFRMALILKITKIYILIIINIFYAIIEVGSYGEYLKKLSGRKRNTLSKIDMLFPIHHSVSITHGGLRTKPDEFTSNQLSILATLNQLTYKNIVVKPFLKAQVLFLLLTSYGSLQNLKIFYHMNLLTCLKN